MSYSVASDYAITHLQNFEPIPSDVVELMEFWDRHYDTRQNAEGLDEQLVASVDRFSKVLDAVRTRDSDVLDPKLVQAIDTYTSDTAHFRLWVEDDGTMFAVLRRGPGLRNLMVASGNFAKTLGSYEPRWLEISEDTREMAQALRDLRAGQE